MMMRRHDVRVCIRLECLVDVYAECAVPGHTHTAHLCPKCGSEGIEASFYDVSENPPISVLVPRGMTLASSPESGFTVDLGLN